MIGSVVALSLSLGTPRILLVFPVGAAIILAIVSLVRRERFRGGAIAVIVLSALLFLLNVSDFQPGHGPTSAASSAQIADWNWSKDPSFGTHGTIKWNVSVKNISQRPISMARVDFSTYDASGKLIMTTHTYVQAIPPGETRSDNSYADLYGTEASANVQLGDVDFATP